MHAALGTHISRPAERCCEHLSLPAPASLVFPRLSDLILSAGRSVENGFYFSGNFLDDEMDERDAQSDREEEGAARNEPSSRADDRERSQELSQSPLALYTSALIRNAKAEASMRESERRKRALVRSARCTWSSLSLHFSSVSKSGLERMPAISHHTQELAMRRQRQLEYELMVAEEEEEQEVPRDTRNPRNDTPTPKLLSPPARASVPIAPTVRPLARRRPQLSSRLRRALRS